MLEKCREAVVLDALGIASARKSFPLWRQTILNRFGPKLTGDAVFELGDHLREVFKSSSEGMTRDGGSSNSVVSTGGAAWESLVCWYLNLLLVGTRAIVIKSKKDFVPKFLADAITVKYNNFKSNTEADLLYIVFPEVENWPQRIESEKFSNYFDRIVDEIGGMRSLSVGVIQTKTNWNDNGQIPMLWDMVYSARQFGRNVQVGSNGRSSFRR